MNNYWRTLEEFADTEEFREFIRREYSSQADVALDPVSRRRFLKLMGASLALAGIAGCARAPTETIVPYVRQPEEIVPGQPLYFATAMPLAGLATGLLVESHMGRPTKVEGNPLHPASLGATDVYAQASVLDLWDPARAQTPTYGGKIRPWDAFVVALRAVVEEEKNTQGRGLRILTGAVSSPTLAEQLRGLLKEYPAARWHQWEPAGAHHTRAGALLAFGSYAQTQYRLDKADIILAFGADLLSCSPGYLRYAHDFARRRRVSGGAPAMNRLYAIESSPSSAGAQADHRLALPPSAMEPFARALAARLGASGGQLTSDHERWLSAVAADLQQHRGRSLVLVSEAQPIAVHALAHAINHSLGNVGQTVVYTEPVQADPVNEIASLRELTQDMTRGAVSTLIIIEGDPVYTAPADLDFAAGLAKVALRAHLSPEINQTSALCQWHIPAAHYLESWSDARAYDGTATILQPLIAPLYQGRTAHELLAALSAQPAQSGYDIVREHWRKQTGKAEGDFTRWWRKSLHDGIVEDSAFAAKALTPKLAASAVISPQPPVASLPGGESADGKVQMQNEKSAGTATGQRQNSKSLELVFRPDPSLYDGRFANNGWLQELPKPLTKLTWDNAAYLSPATANRLGLNTVVGLRGGNVNADVIEVKLNRRTVRAPVWIVPGQAEDTIELQLGYGRSRVGPVGRGVGFDAYRLRTTDGLWSARGAEIGKSGERSALAATQIHHALEGRDIVRAATLEEFVAKPNFAQGESEHPSLYPQYEYNGYKWGLSIDLNACLGCNACVVACQSENNIPVVGKDQVLRSREMHWLRIDTYFTGTPDDPQTFVQPVPCMHCENAPCEVVCPVAATAHSAEGLNDMVYNRCVGTRYCSNNCPYKVRRFNFLQFSDWNTESLKAQRNPDVTVRSRGVMEKCTYCVQRINQGKIDAEKEGRRVKDGEIVTACQQACPAEAIVFGDLNDPKSKVAALKADPRNYSLLEELNTRPRTTYLAALRNPNPQLKKVSSKE